MSLVHPFQVDPSVLREQAEGYVRAIQWNLHYYYHGCISWSWFYRHHYSPWITDIRNFSGMSMDFELSRPFKPFEQLLAVLPAASKELLPKPLQVTILFDLSSQTIPIFFHFSRIGPDAERGLSDHRLLPAGL